MANPIIEKIKKLFRLAGSDNEHEAQLALSRAYELMEKHGIEMSDLQDEPFQVKSNTMKASAQPIEQNYIFPILQNFFHVVPITVTNQYASYDRVYEYRFAGTELHVLIAEHVHDYLLTIFRKLWRDYRKTMSKRLKPKTVKNRHHEYLTGLLIGVAAKLQKAKERVKQQYGIVKIDDAALQKFVEARGTTDNDKFELRDGRHTNAGIRDAQHVNIRKGIEGIGVKRLAAGGAA